MTKLFAELFAALADELEAEPGQCLELWWSEVETYACIRCGMGCRRPWQVPVSRKYYARWARPLAALTGLSLAELFVPLFAAGDQIWAFLAKKPGSDECVLLDEEGLCRAHKQWGAASKPEVCQYYPYTGIENGPSDYMGRALALSCTRAVQMISEPQQLHFRFVAAARSSTQTAVLLEPGRDLTRSAWLMWTGYLLDGLDAGFAAWLGSVAQSLLRLLELPFAQIRIDDIEALSPLSVLPALTAAEQAEILGWLAVAAAQAGFQELLPFLTCLADEPALLSLNAGEAARLEAQLKAYWLRQLLLMSQLVRGELTLVQAMWCVGIEGRLIQLQALCLRQRDGGELSAKHMAEAINQISLWMVRDQAAGQIADWQSLETNQCLHGLRLLARW